MKSRHLIFLALIALLSACKKDGNQEFPQLGELQVDKVLFTDPAKVKLRKENSTEIFDQLIKLLDASPAGSEVHVNIYLFDYKPILNAIVKAHDRGVRVNMLIDRSRDESIATNVSTIQTLQSTLTGHSRFAIVNNNISSGTSGSINHLKYVLFSLVKRESEGEATKVVFSTSSNFTAADMKKIQDAIVISDEGLYSAYKQNWQSIADYADGGMAAWNYQTYSSQEGDINAYFFPRRKNGAYDGNDTIIELLNKITDFKNTTVQIGMSDWSDTRINVAQKLNELKDKGLTIEVIAKSSAGSLVQAELQKLKGKGAYGNILVIPINIHAKFMLIKGGWDGKPETGVVVTGTHNFTSNALKVNNEVMIVLRDHKFFDDYQSYYQSLKNTFK